MKNEFQYFSCGCSSPEHTLRFVLYDEPKEFPELYAEIHMGTWQPWFKRIWVALKFIFKISPTESHFETWTLKPEEARRLREFTENYEQSVAYFDAMYGPKKEVA